jgi:hypothetical protein
MTGMGLIGDDFDAELPAEVMALSIRLRDARPAPSGSFASRTRAHIEAMSSPGPEPRAGALIVAFAAAGTLLLAIGALVTLL